MEVVVQQRAVGKNTPSQGSCLSLLPEWKHLLIIQKFIYMLNIKQNDQPPGLPWDSGHSFDSGFSASETAQVLADWDELVPVHGRCEPTGCRNW